MRLDAQCRPDTQYFEQERERTIFRVGKRGGDLGSDERLVGLEMRGEGGGCGEELGREVGVGAHP